MRICQGWSDIDATSRGWILLHSHTYFSVVTTQPRPACILNMACKYNASRKLFAPSFIPLVFPITDAKNQAYKFGSTSSRDAIQIGLISILEAACFRIVCFS